MKKRFEHRTALMLLIAGMAITPQKLIAQVEVKSSPFSVGGDLVSSYLWRGTKYGTGPAIQPYLDVTIGNFSAGGWGNYCFTTDEAPEADIYLSYGFDFGLSIGVTDYYFPGTPYFDYSKETGAHAFEVNLGYEIAGFSVKGNMFLNEAGGAGNAGQDLYFELGYSYSNFGILIGGGNGWHTAEADPDESDFNVCNIGITASKEIKITETFALPVNGALILNPDTEQFHVVVGLSF
jgi:hypothetical protein